MSALDPFEIEDNKYIHKKCAKVASGTISGRTFAEDNPTIYIGWWDEDIFVHSIIMRVFISLTPRRCQPTGWTEISVKLSSLTHYIGAIVDNFHWKFPDVFPPDLFPVDFIYDDADIYHSAVYLVLKSLPDVFLNSFKMHSQW